MSGAWNLRQEPKSRPISYERTVIPLSRRSRAKVAAIAVAAPLALLAATTVLLGLSGLPITTAIVFAAVAAGLLAVYVGIHLLTVTSGWFPSRRRTWLLAAVWAALIGTGGAAVATVAARAFGSLAVGVGVVVGLVSLPFVRRSSTTSVTSGSPLPSQVRSMNMAEAEAALRAAESRLAGLASARSTGPRPRSSGPTR